MEIQTPAEKLKIIMNAALKLRAQFTEQFKNEPKAARFLTDEFWNKIIHQALTQKQNYHHTQLMGLLTSAIGINEGTEDAMNKLFEMQIAILCAPDDEYFITSDNPGYTLCEHKPDEWLPHNTNFGTMVSITYPINSKQALYIHWGKDDAVPGFKSIHYHTITKEELFQINQTTTNFAYAKIFCASRHYLQAFVDSYPLKDWELESNKFQK